MYVARTLERFAKEAAGQFPILLVTAHARSEKRRSSVTSVNRNAHTFRSMTPESSTSRGETPRSSFSDSVLRC